MYAAGHRACLIAACPNLQKRNAACTETLTFHSELLSACWMSTMPGKVKGSCFVLAPSMFKSTLISPILGIFPVFSVPPEFPGSPTTTTCGRQLSIVARMGAPSVRDCVLHLCFPWALQ